MGIFSLWDILFYLTFFLGHLVCCILGFILKLRVYGAITTESLGCGLHSYLLKEDSVTNKLMNKQTHMANY